MRNFYRDVKAQTKEKLLPPRIARAFANSSKKDSLSGTMRIDRKVE